MSIPQPPRADALNTMDLLASVRDGRELAAADAAHLLKVTHPDEVEALREAAEFFRKLQAAETVGYTSQTSLFFTNLCELNPAIYPYAQLPDSKKAYVYNVEDIDQRLEAARAKGIRQVHLGGGLWPFLQIPGLESPSLLKTYARLIQYLFEHYPEIRITGFSPDEIDFLSIVSDRSHRYILELLRDNGLKTLSGNGAEILVDTVRQKISPKKCRVKTWFAIMKTAHQLEIPATATIGYGHFETPGQRAAHLDKLRTFARQHQGVFSQVIPQPVPYQQKQAEKHGFPILKPIDRFKLLAVTRLFLGTEIPVQQIHWTLESGRSESGIAEAQEGLIWGASHFGPTDALAYPTFLSGSRNAETFTEAEFQAFITQTGRTPEPQ